MIGDYDEDVFGIEPIQARIVAPPELITCLPPLSLSEACDYDEDEFEGDEDDSELFDDEEDEESDPWSEGDDDEEEDESDWLDEEDDDTEDFYDEDEEE